MFRRNWAAWLRSRTPSSRFKRHYRPLLESLEARVAPAFNTTISTANTANVVLNSVAGTATFVASGSGANVNVADILGQLQLGSIFEVDVLNGNTGSEGGDITWLAGADLDYRTIGGNKAFHLTADPSSLTGNINVNSAILDSNPGTESLDIVYNAVGAITTNGTMTVDAVTLAAGGSATIGAAVTTAKITSTSTGTLLVNAPVSVNGNNADLAASAGDIVFNATVAASVGSITMDARNNVLLNGGSATTTGNITLTAESGSISAAGSGTIGCAVLTTSSFTGTTLNNTNAVVHFNATNFTSGDVQFTSSATPLTIDGIQNTVGNVGINGHGGIVVAGAVTTAGNHSVVMTTGLTHDIVFNADVVSGTGNLQLTAERNATLNGGNLTTGGNVVLDGLTGAVSETGAGIVTAASLSISSATGVTLNGSNSVSTFGATNTASGDISLVNKPALILAGVANVGGNVGITNTGAITILTSVSSDVGNVTLASGNGSITETGSATIFAALLSTTSVGGTTLNNANTVASLSATNATSGDVTLANTAAPLTIKGIAESGGNVNITNTGGIVISGLVAAGGSGTITLTAGGAAADVSVNADVSTVNNSIQIRAGRNLTLNAGNITSGNNVGLTASGVVAEAGSGVVTATALVVRSVGGTTLSRTNSVGAFDLVNTGGDVVFVNSSANLNITGIQQLSGGNVTLTTSGGTVNVNGLMTGAGNLALSSSGALTITGANFGTITATGNVTFSVAAGGLSQNGGTITALGLVLSGAGTFDLNQPNAVGFLTAGVNGALTFRNQGDLTLQSIDTQSHSLIVTVAGSVINNQAISAAGSPVTINVGANATFNQEASLTASSFTVNGNNTTSTLNFNYTNPTTWTITGINQGTITNSLVPSGLHYTGMVNVVAANATFVLPTGFGGANLITGNLVLQTGLLKLTTAAGDPVILGVGGNVTLGSGATLEIDIEGTKPGSGGYSKLAVAGSLTLDNTKLDVEVKNGFVPPGLAFTIINTQGPVTGIFHDLQDNPLPDGAKYVTSDGMPFVIHYSSMPGDPGDPVCLYPSSQAIQYSTTTQLGSNANPVLLNQTVTFTIVLIIPALQNCPPNFGGIALMDGGTQVGTGVLQGLGNCKISMSFSQTGAHSITAVYGNTNQNISILTSSSAPLVLTVNQPPLQGGNVFVTGADAGGGPDVKVFDATTENQLFGFFPYNPAFTGGVRVAVGDVNGDGFADVITAAGPGGGPDVAVYSGKDASRLFSFFAFDRNFTGGVFVAAGDVNGDGFADIIVGADAGGGPNISVFSGADNAHTRLTSFFAYDMNFTGGVRVAGADVNGDGFADIICGAGPGGGPNVTAFSGKDNAQTRLYSFFAYDQKFTNGIYVAGGDANGDGKADIFVGAGSGGGPNVSIFSGADASPLNSFFPFPQNFIGGVRIGAAVQPGGVANLVAVEGPQTNPLTGPLSNPQVRILNPLTGALIDAFFAVDPAFTGGLYGAGNA